MANRNFLKHITMGLGVLKWDGFDLGYLKNNVQYDFSYEIEEFKTDVPLVLVGQTTKELLASLKAGVAEVSPENAAIALGGLTVLQSGTTVTISDAANQTRTFGGNFAGSGYQFLSLDGPDATGLILKDPTETTTYVAGTDYLLLGVSDKVLRLPGGAIPEDGQVRQEYAYTGITGQQINLGTQYSLGIGELEFVHRRPNNNKNITVRMHKAQTDGKMSYNWQEQSFIVNDVTFKAIKSDEHPNSPMGWIHWEN